jgi:FSR family fosmidomycin resistance protein-like MFS transporter
MSLFRNKIYLAVTLGHLTLDIFNNAGPVLVTFLSVPMGLSTAQIGLAVGSYQFVSSLIQPFFGWLADKIGSRWLGPGSVTWTISFLVLAVWVAQQTNNFALFLMLFVIGSLGSGAFHPLGTKHAADESGNRTATGTAVFFGFGQTGLALGPVLAGLILEFIGVKGIYGLALLTLPVLIFMFYSMRQVHGEPHALSQPAKPALTAPPEAIRWGAIGVLALLVGLRSWAFLGTVAFLPKIFQDMNWSATGYGLITGTFWFASALTGAVAGGLADRWGRRPMVFMTLFLGAIPLYFLPLNSGWQAFPLAVVAGGLLGASHSILVVIAQDLLPLRKAFASGITLGFLFGVGAVATWSIGQLADVWGLTLLIQLGAGIGILSALLALVLPRTREVTFEPLESTPVSTL